MKCFLTLVFIVLSGLFYRFGGIGKEEQSWIPMFLRKSCLRDWILPLFSLGVLFTWWKPEYWQYYLLAIPSYLLNGFALSTYWGFLNKFLGKDKKDKFWWNWLLHGFFIGFSFFPFYWAGLTWYSIVLNSIISGGLMMWISERTNKVWIEECGRGVITTITRLILLIK
jgi:hypothetical protein